MYNQRMANGKHEENNPRRRPSRPPGMFVPIDSPIRKEEKEMRRMAGNPEVMSTKEQEAVADEALRKRPKQTRYTHDEEDDV